MSQFLNIKKDELHHAYLLEGAKENILEELHEFLESELKFHTKANPDFWSGEFDTFGIDDGRSIKHAQSRVAVGDRKIFVIATNFFTREAQNSLLKIFEEPTENTHFFIITPNAESLLPTLRSRLLIISKPNSNNPRQGLGEIQGLALEREVEFLGVGKAKRLEMIKDIIESKDKQRAIDFLNNLESALYSQLGPSRSKLGEYSFVFEEIIKARSYLNDRAPSIKMLLEHIALITP